MKYKIFLLAIAWLTIPLVANATLSQVPLCENIHEPNYPLIRIIFLLISLIALIVSAVYFVGFFIRKNKQDQKNIDPIAKIDVDKHPWVAIISLGITIISASLFIFFLTKSNTFCTNEEFNPFANVEMPNP